MPTIYIIGGGNAAEGILLNFVKSPAAPAASVSAKSSHEREDCCIAIMKNIHANSKTRLLEAA